jgi:hypothetical protein
MMTRAEQLARLVLLFHHGGWDDASRSMWREITGHDDATTKSLCDFAREILREENPDLRPFV